MLAPLAVWEYVAGLQRLVNGLQSCAPIPDHTGPAVAAMTVRFACGHEYHLCSADWIPLLCFRCRGH